MVITDTIYIVVTVGRRKNSYDLRVRQPKSLAQNQFAYKLRIPVDKNDWYDRVKEVFMGQCVPPRLPVPDDSEVLVEKDTPQKVLDRMQDK